jgi:hypothetical protein
MRLLQPAAPYLRRELPAEVANDADSAETFSEAIDGATISSNSSHGRTYFPHHGIIRNLTSHDRMLLALSLENRRKGVVFSAILEDVG